MPNAVTVYVMSGATPVGTATVLDSWFSTIAGTAPLAVAEPSANSTFVGAPGTGSHGPCSERTVTVASTVGSESGCTSGLGSRELDRTEVAGGVVRVGNRPHDAVV